MDMDELSKQISEIGVHDIRNADLNPSYLPYQIIVRQATTTDSWGPTPKHLNKLLNDHTVSRHEQITYLLKRLLDHIRKRKNFYARVRKEWNKGVEYLIITKCLTCIEFLLLRVEEYTVVVNVLKEYAFVLRKVKSYKVVSADGRPEIHEANIHNKVDKLLDLVMHPQKLDAERKKVAKLESKAAGHYVEEVEEYDTGLDRYADAARSTGRKVSTTGRPIREAREPPKEINLLDFDDIPAPNPMDKFPGGLPHNEDEWDNWEANDGAQDDDDDFGEFTTTPSDDNPFGEFESAVKPSSQPAARPAGISAFSQAPAKQAQQAQPAAKPDLGSTLDDLFGTPSTPAPAPKKTAFDDLFASMKQPNLM